MNMQVCVCLNKKIHTCGLEVLGALLKSDNVPCHFVAYPLIVHKDERVFTCICMYVFMNSIGRRKYMHACRHSYMNACQFQ